MSGQPGQRNIGRHVLIFGCAIPGVLMSVLLAAVIWLIAMLPPREPVSEFATKGYPETLEGLNAWYPEPPEGENAATFYMEAGKRLYLSKSSAREFLPYLGDAKLPPLGEPLPDHTRNFVNTFMEDMSKAYELIDEAAQYDAGRYPVTYEMFPAEEPVTYFDMVKSAHHAQKLRVMHGVSDQTADELLDAFDKLVHISRSIMNEPTLSSQAVANRLIRDTVSMAEFLLNVAPFTRAQLARLEESLASLDDDDRMLRGFVGDRYIAKEDFAEQVGGNFLLLPFRDGMLKVVDEYIELVEAGLPAKLADYTELADDEPSVFNFMSAVLTPGYHNAITSHYSVKTYLDAARTALAIERWRLPDNDLPGTREEFPESITATWPIDPFSGDPLEYAKRDAGYVVFGVGRDMLHNGGGEDEIPSADRSLSYSGDIVFYVLK
jgi:hypothetical protein